MASYEKGGRRVCALPEPMVPFVDREAWNCAIRPETVFNDGGPAANWAPTTKSGVWVAYRRWLLYLSDNRSLSVETHIANRVTPESVMAFIKSQQLTSASSSVASHMIFFGMAMRVMAPDRDWAWLSTAILNLKRVAKPAKDKRGRIVASSELIDLGMALMDEAGIRTEVETWPDAVKYRDGLIIALLAARPLRRKNFLGTRLGKNLVERGGKYRLQFDSDETKNKEPIEQPFPEFLNEPLRHYLSVVRPFLLASAQNHDSRRDLHSADDYLWVSISGRAMATTTFTVMVKERTERVFGQSVTPHLFRDCLATSQATDDPEHVATTRITLGHKSSKTAERHYNHAQGLEASKRMQAHVLALRRGDTVKVGGWEYGVEAGYDDDDDV